MLRPTSYLSVLVIAGVLGCTGSETKDDPMPNNSQQPPSDSVPMTPKSEGAFVDGPAIAPASGLRAWLDGEIKSAKPRPRIKLPVMLVWQDEHRLAIGRAFVGVSGDEPAADAIRLELDDSGMGVSLKDQIRSKCPEGQAACGFWLEGHWGPLVSAGPSFAEPGTETFAVLAVGEPIAEGADPATTRAQRAR